MASAARSGRQQPEAAGSTASASPPPAHSGEKTSKDRPCKFCGQTFTSSSLGRHLDLYIKPKNPKPPDGLHDVEEIKSMRGGITRRQPRTSLKAARGSDGGSRRQSTEDSPPAVATSKPSNKPAFNTLNMRPVDQSPAAVSPVNAQDVERVRLQYNHPSWQATGVINDIPPSVPSRINARTSTAPMGNSQAQRLQDMRRDLTGNHIPRPDYQGDAMLKLQEAAEVGRAAELALREVLSSLEAARSKVEPQSLFEDVDFYALTFPALCLAILPAPTTLFSPAPFAPAESWTITPPGQKQSELLTAAVYRRLHVVHDDPRTKDFPEIETFRVYAHLQAGFEHWQAMSEVEKSATWNLEILRAFTRTAEQNAKLKQESEGLQTRVRHLEAEYDRLVRYQLPREYLQYPHRTLSISSAVMKEVASAQAKAGLGEVTYDADALLSKWRTTVRGMLRKPTVGSTPSTISHPAISPSTSMRLDGDSTPLGFRRDLLLNGSVWGVNGPMPRGEDVQAHLERPDENSSKQVTAGHVGHQAPMIAGAVASAPDCQGDGEVDAERDREEGPLGDFYGQDAMGVRQMAAANVAQRSIGESGVAASHGLNVNGKRPLEANGTRGRQSL